MPLWRIYAVANPNDSRWQGRKIWKEVVVRAPTAAMARLLASELDSRINDARNGGDWSGFHDEKLYWVNASVRNMRQDLDQPEIQIR